MNEIDALAEALKRMTPADRAAFLDDICRENHELRRCLESGPATSTDAGATVDLPTALVAVESRHEQTSATVDLPSADAATMAETGASLPRAAEGRRGEGLGTVIAGRYTLVEVIGEGGMGSVYRASQSEPVKRQVALKLIKTGMDSRGVLARFDAERQALAMMDHPNIARIYDGGVTPAGQPFFVMELVQGVPLTDYCDQKRLSVKGRLDLFVSVCQAVQHAHQKGIIHRDLKPGNVLVAEVDGKPTPKVIDFGVAKATEVTLTDMSFSDVGAIVGTPSYMSPEQADPTSMDIDTRTDVYALGVMLYELLTGAPPIDATQFKRGAVLEMLRMVREVDPPRPSTRVGTAATLPDIAAVRSIDPSQLRRTLAGDLDWIVMKALEKDRARRYDTANGLAADIGRHLASEPVLAAPPSRAYRIRKFVRKNRGGVIAAGIVLTALVVGIVGTTWGLIQASRANRALAAKNEELAEEQAKVEQRFELAQKAIGTFHSDVSEDVLMRNDQFKELRTKLLREAAGFYGDLETLLEGQTDARSHKLLGDGYAQLGDLTARIGEPEKALSVHRKALEVRRSLAAHPGASREVRLDVARTLRAIGELLLKTGDSEGSLQAHEEQVDIAGGLEAEAATADVEEVLARGYSAVGNTLERTNRLPQAREAWRKASALWRRLAEGHPTEPRYRLELGKSYSDLGVQLRMQGDELEEAVTVQEKGLAILETLVSDHPTVAEYLYELALAYDGLGWAKTEMLWRPMEARAAYENSLALFSNLAKTYPAVNDYQSKQAEDYDSFASLLEYSGKWAEALDAQRKGLAVSRKLVEGNLGDLDARWKNGMIYQESGRVLLELGHEAEGMEALQKGLESFRKVAEVDPSLNDSLRHVCWSHDDIGVLLERTGKPTEALEAYGDGMAAAREYAVIQPSDLLIQRRVAFLQAHRGRLHRDAGRLPEALEGAQAAVQIRRKLSADADPIEVRNLPGAMILEASILLRLGRTVEARTVLDEAITILSEAIKKLANRPAFTGELAHGYLRLGQARQVAGDTAGAVADWTRAIDIEKSIATVLSGPQTFEYACAHAALAGVSTDPAEAAAHADRALALLKQATRMTFRNPATFRTEPALDPLRDRDDFQALINDLNARAAGPLADAPATP